MTPNDSDVVNEIARLGEQFDALVHIRALISASIDAPAFRAASRLLIVNGSPGAPVHASIAIVGSACRRRADAL